MGAHSHRDVSTRRRWDDAGTEGDNGVSRRGPGPSQSYRTHYLYIAVIVAVVAGIVLGLAAPGVAEELKPLGTGFVSLIKMMISPIIFCTIVLGVGSIRSAAKVGKLGGLALATSS